MAKMIILDASGDTEVAFQRSNAASVKAAMDRFNELVRDQKHWAYKTEKDGSKTIIKSFDETADEILIHPQMIGG